jgi:hypothetical protein
MRGTHYSRQAAIEIARNLASEHGDNREYDRALVELIRELYGGERQILERRILKKTPSEWSLYKWPQEDGTYTFNGPAGQTVVVEGATPENAVRFLKALNQEEP